jgi:hypothetical protein
LQTAWMAILSTRLRTGTAMQHPVLAAPAGTTIYALRDPSEEHVRATSVSLSCVSASRRLASRRVVSEPRAHFLRTERDRR